MKNKLFAMVSILVVMTMILTACAKETEAPPPPEEAEEITFITQVSEAEEAAIEEIAALFEEETGIKVNVQFMQATDMQALLQSQIEADNITVDVMAQDNLRMEPFVRLGLIEDLSALESDIDPAVFKGLIEGGKFDGKLYFVPYRTNVQLTYYRTDIFDELGLAPPSTWDEWRAACEAFLARDGEPRCLFKGAFDPTAVNPTQTWEWIVSAGGDPLVLNDAGTVAAYEFLQGLEQDGLLHPDSAIAKWDTSNESFARGDAYLMQNWPFGIGVIRDLGLTDFDVYHGAAGPVREAHVVGGEVLAIVKGTPRKDAAWGFVKFLESVAAQEILAAKNGWPNVRGDALGQISEDRMVEFETVNDALEYGILRPNIPYMEDLLGIMIEAYDRIVNDGEDAQTVLDELNNDLMVVRGEAPAVRYCADGLEGETITFYSQAGLTGALSTILGTGFVGALNDSIADLNAAGGICGATVELSLVDTQYEAEQEIAAYQIIREDDPPPFSIATYGSAASIALAPLVNEDHVVNFAAGLNAEAFYVPRDGWTVGVAPIYSDQFAGFMKWLSEDWESIKPEGAGDEIVIGVIGWDHPFGAGATTAEALAYAESVGVTVLPLEVHPITADADLATPLMSLVAQGANVIYYQGLGPWVAMLIGTVHAVEMWDSLVVGGCNWSMNTDILAILGESAPAMIGYYGVFPYNWWNDTDVPGVQQALAAFEAGGYPETDKGVSYLTSYAGTFAWAEIAERAIDNVGFENLDGDAFFDAFKEMGTVTALGVFTYDVRDQTRAPRESQIRRTQLVDGEIQFVVVRDFFELPDTRPPAE